jgi:single-strand DNA-binding protein
MGRGLNKIMLIGTVDHEPDLRFTPGGKSFTSFSVGAPRIWITTEGERHEETEWFDVVAWGTLAEICKQQLAQGSRVFMTGRLQTRVLDGSSGQRQHRSEVVVNNVVVLSAPSEGEPVTATDNGFRASTAMPGLNSIMLIGNLGRNPELRYTPSGKPVTSFTLATSRTWSTSEGEKREETEWFNVISWGNLAEICNRYLERGSRVYIEGRLQTREWEDAGGLTHNRTEVVADEMIRLDMRPSAVKKDEFQDSSPEPDPLFPERSA